MPELSRRNKRARRNLALKLALENTFTREVKSYFNNVRKAVINDFIRTGEIRNGASFNIATKSMLEKHYRRVARAFSNEMRLYVSDAKMMHLIEIKQMSEDDMEKLIAAILAVSIVNRATEQADVIDQTTTNNINEAFAKSSQELIEEGTPVTTPALAAAVSVALKRALDGRVSTIALTETQIMAETTKQIEAAVMSREGDVNIIAASSGKVDGNPEAKKEWASAFLPTTRDPHAIADGQVVNMNDFFIVDGERFQYPGDTQHGASVANYANCKCSALYDLVF